MNAKLRMKFKYWIIFMFVISVLAISVVMFIEHPLVNLIGIEIAGSSIFILLISIAFHKIML